MTTLMRRVGILAGIVFLLFVVERQVTGLTLANSAGRSGVLERDHRAVPATLYVDVPPDPGAAEVLPGGWVPFGYSVILRLPDGEEIRCNVALGSVRCADGWRWVFEGE